MPVSGAVRRTSHVEHRCQPTVLLELSERLAFERTGTRMYEGLIAKIEASGESDLAFLEDVRRFHDEERAHMVLGARDRAPRGAIRP